MFEIIYRIKEHTNYNNINKIYIYRVYKYPPSVNDQRKLSHSVAKIR